MRGFKTNENGDVLLYDGDIAMISGDELLRQTVQHVMNTNKGEWFLDEDEGIDFASVLGKDPDEDVVRAEVTTALQQVDETFILQEFTMQKTGRNLKVTFKAANDDGNEIGGGTEYGS